MHVLDCQGRIKQSDHSEEDYMLKNLSGANYRIKGGNLQLYNLDDEAWHTIFAVGPPAAEQIALGGADVSDPDELISCT